MSRDERYREIEEAILAFLDSLEPSERVEVLDDFLHRLNFERRLALLTPEELNHLCDEGLSSQQRAALDQEKPNSESYKERLNMYVRVIYFKRCAWMDYLNGHTDKKPFSSE